MRKIALFGTSADPPTIGHQMILEWLAQHFDQVAVWAADNPFKGQQTPLFHRQAMLQRLVDPMRVQHPQVDLYPDLSNPRSLKTVQQARQRWPEAEFTLVVGSDVIPTMSHWYRIEDLLTQVKILIVPRPEAPLAPSAVADLLRHGADLAIADLIGPAVSSSDYRQTGNTQELTPAVATYIHEKGLYPCIASTKTRGHTPMNTLTQTSIPHR